jgi:tRNA nucleotidyltransferase/poly(A) polymerase
MWAMNAATDASTWRMILDRAAAVLDDLGATGWIVGGCLRDALLGVPVHDVDLAVTADPVQVARSLLPSGGGGIARLRRATVRVAFPGPPEAHLDLARLHGRSIADDLAARDFRINALALPLAAREGFLGLLQPGGAPMVSFPAGLIDPLGGLDDLRARRLDVVGAAALSDDPGRILRGARLAAQLELAVAPATVELARAAAPALRDLSPERVREELSALLAERAAVLGAAFLRDVDALVPLFPGLEHVTGMSSAQVQDHIVGALATLTSTSLPSPRGSEWYAEAAPGETLPRLAALGWAVVLHALTPHDELAAGDGGDAPAEDTVVRRSPIPKGLPRRVSFVVGAWPEARRLLARELLDMSAVHRLFDRAGQGGEPALDALVVALACQDARVIEPEQELLDTFDRMLRNVYQLSDIYFEEPERLMPQRLIDGALLAQRLGIAQGPMVGRILREIRAEQLAGALSTAEEALARARELASRED